MKLLMGQFEIWVQYLVCREGQGKKKSDKISLISWHLSVSKFGGPMAKRKRGDCESKIHIEIGYFNEQHTFANVKWKYFRHGSMKSIRRVIYECDHC
jgi:hypothetical protein